MVNAACSPFRLAVNKILLRHANCPATLAGMKRISPRLRRQIDEVAAELSGVAQALAPDFPGLAAVYSSFSGAIDSSHYSVRGTHVLTIDIPKGCSANIVNRRSEYGDQEHFVLLSIPHQPAPRAPAESEVADA